MEGRPSASAPAPPADGAAAVPEAGREAGASGAGRLPAFSPPVGEEAAGRLETLYRLLRERRHLGLTGFRSPEALVERYFGDALALRPHLPAAGPCLDIGSGAGTPALPLAVAAGGGDWLLLEPRRRAAAFLESAIEDLGLASRIRVLRLHFKDYLNQEEAPEYLGRVAAVTLRAVRLKKVEWRGLAAGLRLSAVVIWPTSEAGRERADLPEGLFEEERRPAERGIVWRGTPRVAASEGAAANGSPR